MIKKVDKKEMNDIKYEGALFDDVCLIIENARGKIATFVNSEICLTNWYVGKRIKEDVLFNRRAEYGKQVLKSLSIKLVNRFGKGWGVEKLKQCVRSAYIFRRMKLCTQRVHN